EVRQVRPRLCAYTTMTEYDAKFAQRGIPVAFPPEQPTDILPELVARAGARQLRCAETGKYAHVTFFFNGGRETVFPGEERILVPRPRSRPTISRRKCRRRRWLTRWSRRSAPALSLSSGGIRRIPPGPGIPGSAMPRSTDSAA